MKKFETGVTKARGANFLRMTEPCAEPSIRDYNSLRSTRLNELPRIIYF